MIQIKKSEHLSDTIKSLKLGLVEAKNVKVSESDARFEKELNQLENELKKKFVSKLPSDDEVVSATRRMYRQVGWEPTKYRPSSEALVRRLIKGKGLYRINNFVDYGNMVSARFHIPMGLYDLDKINSEIIIGVGQENEFYEGISKARITATGKIILRDSIGVFGNPTADSKRTAIQKNTKNILAVLFISAAIEKKYAHEAVVALKQHYASFTKEEIKTEIIIL